LLSSVTEVRLIACRKNSRRVCCTLMHLLALVASIPLPKLARILRRRWQLPRRGVQR
jgi:hypothetical protein